MKARITPRSSMPWWVSKRLSSAATKAFWTIAGTSAIGTLEAPAIGLEGLGVALARAVEDQAGAGELALLQGLGRGQVGHRLVVEGDDLGRVEGRVLRASRPCRTGGS